MCGKATEIDNAAATDLELNGSVQVPRQRGEEKERRWAKVSAESCTFLITSADLKRTAGPLGEPVVSMDFKSDLGSMKGEPPCHIDGPTLMGPHENISAWLS